MKLYLGTGVDKANGNGVRLQWQFTKKAVKLEAQKANVVLEEIRIRTLDSAFHSENIRNLLNDELVVVETEDVIEQVTGD